MGQAVRKREADNALSVVWQPQPGPQTALLACSAFEVFYGGARGGGKCLPLSEPVLTPFGWRGMGDIKPAAQVCNPNGSVSRVLAVHRPGKAQVWKITFSDDATAVCDDGHLWLGHWVGHKIKRKFSSRLWRFADIRAKFEADKDGRFLIPLTEPVTFTRPIKTRHGNTLPVDPYILGILLGDGCLTGDSIRYATLDDEIDAEFARHGDLRVDAGPNRRLVNAPVVLAGLRRLGVWGKHSYEKSVPEAYLWAGKNTRVAILQGLMDSDGTADSRGQCYFSSCSEQLAQGVQWLCRSLGFKATLTSKETTHRRAYQIYIQGPERGRLFRLSRKRERAEAAGQPGHHARRIVSIESAGVCDVGCFQVDDPNGLFLTRDFVVTHNTDGMLGEWSGHASKYGKDAAGVFFRRSLTQLDETIERSKDIYYPLGAVWKEQKKTWLFPGGARLKFRPLERDADAEKYQGHSYSRVYVEEMTNFPDPTPVMKLKATLRSAAGVPTGYRATGNPGGPGHQWVKMRYIDPAPGGFKIIRDEEGLERIFIPAKVEDNQALLSNDPLYVARLKASGSAELVRAWLEGDWDIIIGAFFDCWRADKHVVRPVELPAHWVRFRAFDWGSARPFSCLWIAVSDGTLPQFPRGALVVYREWYGASAPNVGLKLPVEDVAKGIVERERGDKIDYSRADPSIFSEDGGPSLATRMYDAAGVSWTPADNGRIAGWDQVRQRLLGEDDKPMLYVFSTCVDLIRTLPALQHDEHRPEDVNTESEDHAPDALRYGCMSRPYVREPELTEAEQREVWLEEKKRRRYSVKQERRQGAGWMSA